MHDPTLRKRLDALYNGGRRPARAFRYGLLAFDLVVVAFVIVTSFISRFWLIEVVDFVMGVVILLDFSARTYISRNRIKDLLHPAGIADIIVIMSLLAPIAGEGLAFLRVMRTLRLLRSYQILVRLRRDSTFFRRNEIGVFSALNLFVFIFVTTALVFETQHLSNPNIANYADALYFTVATLTTTGFGDITLTGTMGRLLSVAIMIFGVSLFIRLVQVLLRPSKVTHECPDCGLKLHDADAIHCKHCGRVLHIASEGQA
ncbi:MAG: potassium channel family protein [Proteobacteria bacterium]|nr:potassium channel family protein [Pseudomonadota bacterium]